MFRKASEQYTIGNASDKGAECLEKAAKLNFNNIGITFLILGY